MARMGRRLSRQAGAGLRFSVASSLAEAVDGSDFLLCSIGGAGASGSSGYYESPAHLGDKAICARYGVPQIVGDTAVSLPPLNHRLARDLIDRTRVSKLLDSFRNVPAIDRDALVEVLLAVSTIACELPWIREMDINPIIADEHGVVAVDARIVVGYPQPSSDPYNHLAIHPYPAHLVKRVQLNDGIDIVIRPIRPEDAEIEARFVRELSSESKYFRFMNTFEELSQEMLVRFTQIDYHNEMALIAVTATADSEEQVGVARYTTNLDKRSCEFALVVSDRWRGRGIAHHLMLNLMDVARGRELETIEGIVLKSNSRMLALMESLNFEISNDREDPSVKRVVAQLHKPH